MKRFYLTAMLLAGSLMCPCLGQKNDRPLFFLENIQAINERISNDALASLLYTNILNTTEDFSASPYTVQKKGKLLGLARKTSQQILQHALLFRLTGKRQHLNMAEKYLQAACSLQSWNPKHFLDVAEFTFGVAIGANWLDDYLDPKLKKQIRTALYEKSFSVFERATARAGGRFWTRGENNWTLVCNSALYVAAVLNPDIELSSKVRRNAYQYLQNGLELYSPDGLWAEGPMYWSYATNFAMFAIETEQWRSGKPSSMRSSSGLDKTLETYFDLVGPSGRTFNFGDAKSAGVGPIPAVLRLAAYFQQWEEAERYTDILKKRLVETDKHLNHRFLLFNLLWLPDRMPGGRTADAKNIKVIRGDFDVAVVNTAIGNGRSLYLAMKGGNAGRPHQHRDAGTFVLDMGGTRFFSDLGKEEYGLKTGGGKKIDKRSVFRVSSASHNVLIIGGTEQAEVGSGSTVLKGKGKSRSATLDLSRVYPESGTVTRTVSVSGESILLEDYMSEAGGEVVWQAYTRAKVKVLPDGAMLTGNGKELLLRILEPADAVLTTDRPQPSNRVETPVKGFTRIRIKCPSYKELRIRVRFSPK